MYTRYDEFRCSSAKTQVVGSQKTPLINDNNNDNNDNSLFSEGNIYCKFRNFREDLFS